MLSSTAVLDDMLKCVERLHSTQLGCNPVVIRLTVASLWSPCSLHEAFPPHTHTQLPLTSSRLPTLGPLKANPRDKHWTRQQVDGTIGPAPSGTSNHLHHVQMNLNPLFLPHFEARHLDHNCKCNKLQSNWLTSSTTKQLNNRASFN